MLIEVHHETDEHGNVFTLMETIDIRWRGKTVVIPAGFKSDGASVPRFFWRAVFPPGDNRAMRAAFAHDYIYRTHPDSWTKIQADAMFYDLLISGGIHPVRAALAWLGVHFFGRRAWKEGGQK